MGKFLLFVLMLILAAVIFVVVILANILGGFMRLIKGLFGGIGAKNASYNADNQQQASKPSADEKIFKEEDKEYVEFEEVDN